jgi:hypothetical protein
MPSIQPPAWDSAHAMLDRFAESAPREREQMMNNLRPQPDDYRRLFGEQVAWDAEAGYLKLWAAGPMWPWLESSVISVCHATSDDLKAGRAVTFPTGYQHIAYWLEPGFTWTMFSLSQIGRLHLMPIDGLVEIDPGRWVWCPRPWHVLPSPPVLNVWWE